MKKAWSVHGEILSAMKRSANKYSILEVYDESEIIELQEMRNREKVDELIQQKRIPTGNELRGWNKDKIDYYEKKKLDMNKEGSEKEMDDVFKDMSGIAESMKNDVLETHIKPKRFNKVSDSIFGRWEWCSNMQFCDKGCRIMLGWDNDRISMNVVQRAKQAILCEINTVNGDHRIIVGGKGWIIMGDMNVTLNPNEHLAGSSSMSSDMYDFRDCVNNIEVEDLVSSGLFFTWTKNLFKVKAGDSSGVLKKLDTIMGDEDFIDKFPHAHAMFLPYLISDHSPNVLIIPNVIEKKRKTFKFANFTADKKEFIPTVSRIWGKEYEGCQIVKILKVQLSEIQVKIDKNPSNKDLRMEESLCMQSYVEALKDEEKLLYQKAKIKWLSFVEAMKDEEKLLSTSKALRISERDKTPSLLMSREVNWESMLNKQTDTFMMSSVNPDDFAHFKIPLEDVLSATNNFAEKNLRGEADFGNHYEGQLFLLSGELIDIYAQRWNNEWDEKEQQFWMEIFMLSTLKHKNLVSLVGFCDENDERIIIIKLETMASLDNYLSDTLKLTWVRRLEIGVAIAHALSYIHYDESRDFSVIHGNINSDTILLNDSWEPKLCEFRLSMKIEASERHHSFRVDKVRDMEGYTDPTYIETNMANHKSDIYSFGIVMFELLCGRKSVIANDTNKYLAPMAISHYTEKKLHEIIDWGLWKQIDSESFNIFAETAYDCLNEERSQRPNIDDIVPKLEKALKLAYENRPSNTPLAQLLTVLGSSRALQIRGNRTNSRNQEVWKDYNMCIMTDGHKKAQCKFCFHFFAVGSNTTLKNHISHPHCEVLKAQQNQKP
ncbi:kinase-like domain, phloem protein 2-like protein [Tanacetum coccineum]